MILKLYLDHETTERLTRVAEAEYRPISLQAEVLIRRAVGLPVPRLDLGELGGGNAPPVRLMLPAPVKLTANGAA